MKMTRIARWLSLTVVGGVLVFIAVTDREERVPQVYYSLDKTRPWSELASTLDPRMSKFDYDKMRSSYFYDVVAPKLSDKESEHGAYLYWMQQTDRPWRWDRLPIGEPPRAVLLVFWVSVAYLVVILPMWAWKKVFKPIGLIAGDEGLAGVAQVILHGKKSKPKERGLARGSFHLVGLDEDGVKGKSEKRRLVCVIESGGKLAIWGQELPSRNMRNIDSVLKTGMPLTVECEYREPEDWAKKYGHTHWVAQDFDLRVL
jgi:hypothetical protein